MTDISLDIAIPSGYLEMPLSDIDRRITDVLAQAPETVTDMMGQVLTNVGVIVKAMVDKGARFCGMGRHRSPDVGDTSYIVSWLVVSVYESGDTGNPRLVLARQAQTWADAAESGSAELGAEEPGEVELTDLDGRPVMVCEGVSVLPTPKLEPARKLLWRESGTGATTREYPDGFLPREGQSSTTRVHRIQAVVPSEDGSVIVIINLATLSTDRGPEFRSMVVEMARSVRFHAHRVDDLVGL